MDKKIDTVREALVEKVITFFNNRLTIGETEDECGDLVSVLELDKDFRSDLAKMFSAIAPEAVRPSEDTEKLCHQIYDVLPISPALKLLDDGKLYALITAHDEAIRMECAEKAIDYIDKTYESINRDAIRASILSPESAQDNLGTESNPFKGTYNAVVFQRHDNGLNFGVCERDDGFEFVVHGTNRESSHYALHRNAIMERLDELAQDDGKPEVEPRLLVCSACGDIETEPYEQGDSCPMCGMGVYQAAELKRHLEEAKE